MSESLAVPAPKLESRLRSAIREHGSALVALSGGVDSSVVAAIAAQELGSGLVAATGVSASLDSAELSEITEFCSDRGITHVVVQTHELGVEGYVDNTPDRCFYCKDELYRRLGHVARERGLRVVLDGTSAEDLGGHRPGHRAAGEHGVLSPLVEVGASKRDIREIATRLSLPTASRPASPCLSSRIAYGISVTPERLERVGRGEAALKRIGFSALRVRLHGPIARIEVPSEEFGRALEHADSIVRELRAVGFTYVTLDLAGLRSGSLLEVVGQS